MINFRGLFSKKVLLAMFYDLKHDFEIAVADNYPEDIRANIFSMKRAVLEALEGDFSPRYIPNQEMFKKIIRERLV